MNHDIEPSTALPPWIATCERERDQMVRWVIAQLDTQDAEDGMRQHELDATRDYCAPLPVEELQRLRFEEVIRRGDVETLRRLYPEIAKFIHRPKRPQGRRRSYPRNNWGHYWASMIADDVRRVREIWKANYDGKWKRRGLRPTAEEIVAERRGLTKDDVIGAIRLLQH
jgi:hypothetical protein